MCRIAGLITNRAPEDAKGLLSSMISSMLHERFDTYGTYCVPELGCYVSTVADGNARMERGPVVNQRGDQIIVFAGENFTDEKPAVSAGSGGRGPDHGDATSL